MDTTKQVDNYPVPRNSKRGSPGAPAKAGVIGGAVVGGLLGVPLGIPGVILGATTGGLAGKAVVEHQDSKRQQPQGKKGRKTSK